MTGGTGDMDVASMPEEVAARIFNLHQHDLQEKADYLRTMQERAIEYVNEMSKDFVVERDGHNVVDMEALGNMFASLAVGVWLDAIGEDPSKYEDDSVDSESFAQALAWAAMCINVGSGLVCEISDLIRVTNQAVEMYAEGGDDQTGNPLVYLNDLMRLNEFARGYEE